MRTALFCLAALLVSPVRAETIEILRDAYGVPHIFAATPAGAAFGAGYAQAEDRAPALLRNLSVSDGGALAPHIRVMAEAFAAGVNQALGREAVTAAHVAAYSRRAFMSIEGSGDFLMGPERTGGDGVIAVIDPYSTWTDGGSGAGKPYEMRLYWGDRAISGLAPVGLPFPIVGHSRAISIAWSGSQHLAGPRALEQAWAMLNASSMREARAALEIDAIPGDVMIGSATGEIFDTASVPEKGPEGGYVMRHRASKQAEAALRQVLYVQHTWSLGRVAQAAVSTEVAQAEKWQQRLSKVDPGMPLVQTITGWDRRAEAQSMPALAFYLFKMELGREAAMTEPPSSLSDGRIKAALDRVRNRMYRLSPDEAVFGSLFRILYTDARDSYGVGGGTVSEAGMETPRTIRFEKRGAVSLGPVNIGVGGQTATQVVHLRPGGVDAVSLLQPGLPDIKPSYFGNRAELEKVAVSKKQLIF